MDIGEYDLHITKLGWITTGIKIKDLAQIEQLKFEITVLVIDVFDINGNNICDKYESIQSPLQHTLNTKSSNRTWAIHDRKAIKMLWLSEHGVSFESGFFKIHKLKWNIK